MEKSRDNEDFADQQGKKGNASRWSLVSLGFPVIVGTLCAMAIMFNICATAQDWQQTIHANNQTIKPSLPHWQVYLAWCLFSIQSQTKVLRNVALKALSLALASTAYILYLLVMAFHYTSRSGFTIAVFGWLASAIILLILIGIEVRQHRNIRTEQSMEYTQNFYAGIFAASLYCLIAFLLAAYMASSNSLHLSPTDRRTVECSSIIHRVITFTIILLGGAGIYSTIEDWSLMDALYFTDYTVLTIGIGNITPQTHLGRSLLFPYATAGIISLGFVISGVASFTNRVRNLKLRYALLEARRTFQIQITEISRAGEEAQSTVPVLAKFPEKDEVLELHRIKSKFYRRSRWQDLIFFSVAWFILWLISAEIFRRSEKSEQWTYFTALYFTYTSLTTIGYGDYHPTSNFGKAFFVFWSLLALPILTNLVTTMGEVLHRLMLVLYGYVWRSLPHRGSTSHHHSHEDGCRFFENTSENLSDSPPSHMVETDHEPAMEEHRLHLSSVRPTPLSKHKIGTAAKKSMQYRLCLAEEMTKLLCFLRNESVDNWEELCCTWSRVIALLHAEESYHVRSQGISSFEVSSISENLTMMKIMDPKRAVAERNAEILWMMALLVKKLSSDSRRELFEVS